MTAAIAVTLILFCSIQLVATGRGFDFTDEAFYVLNYFYFGNIETLATLFGAYFHWPFVMLGGSIRAIRIFGIVALLAATAYFINSLWVNCERAWGLSRVGRYQVLIATTAACFGFYSSHFATLITPGYNLLGLVCLLLATAIFINAIWREPGYQGERLQFFIYGIILSIAFFNKFSTAVALFAIHIALAMVSLKNSVTKSALVNRIGWGMFGFISNLLLLLLIVPNLAMVVTQGFIYYRMLLPREIAAELYSLMTRDFPATIILSLHGWFWLGFAGFLAAIIGCLSERKIVLNSGLVIMILALLFDPDYRWLPKIRVIRGIEVVIFLISIYYVFTYRKNQVANHSWRFFISLLLIAILPFAYSFGTGVDFFSHTAMSVVFPLSIVLILLAWIRTKNVISIHTLLAGALCVALVPLDNLLRPWLFAGSTYRLGNPLTQENVPIRSMEGELGIATDEKTVAALSNFFNLLQQGNFQPGTPMIDFTGHSPGLVYISQGRPIGTLWLLGNYPGSNPAAQFALGLASSDDLRRAWLLTSEDDYRRLEQWQEILTNRLGRFGWIAVGSVVFPQWQWKRLDDPKPATVTVWKPTE